MSVHWRDEIAGNIINMAARSSSTRAKHTLNFSQQGCKGPIVLIFVKEISFFFSGNLLMNNIIYTFVCLLLQYTEHNCLCQPYTTASTTLVVSI